MSRFEVDSARVQQAGAAVSVSAAALASEVDGMMRHLLDLESCWKGEAASGFQALSAQWRGTQDRVRASLEEIQRALAQAGRQYADVETANARMFAG
ncbi:WXG100 family type VII secretion target [Kineococcus indalonis]|uniref:WXG100 family type VII secretion target n=1 Tax=Kineococcus indalonis TaxID=2696566 RepID=UPI0014129192|nr:WXG100 family type VII secretion target [Kineococcus indalonis]NAZ86436.1 WXG100 family type VII secretion target [Kineococcus indalonis]